MAFHSILPFLLLGGAVAEVRTRKQLPFILGDELPEPPVSLRLPLPEPNDFRRLRGPAVQVGEMPLAFRAVPMDAVSLELPDVEAIEGPPVVDGPLRDLLNFGSALGAAVLRPDSMPRLAHHKLGGAEGTFGAPLELPLEALHVKMQDHVPAALSIDDSRSKVRIYGTLPKNLTAKTLKVSLAGADGRNLVVRYFLGKGAEAGKNLVGIDEHFLLDFSPTETPAVKYKSSTGTFELSLNRPAAKPQKQISIDFDAPPATASKPIVASKSQEVGAARKDEIALHRIAPLRRSRQRVASAKEFVHASRSVRLPASQVKAGLEKVAKDLKHVASAKRDKAARVQEVKSKAKQFVADARLDDAQRELEDAFAPLDMGLVMLEKNHRIRPKM